MRILSAGLALAWLTAGLLVLSSAQAPAEARSPAEARPPAGYQAWIAIAQEGGLYRIEPFCRAPEDARLAYRLTARKQGPAGLSSSSQSGQVRARAGQPQALCRLALGVRPGDRYEFVLEVFREGIKVAEASAGSPESI